MKIRMGFVSNSSTSSFVVLGFKLDKKINYRSLAERFLNMKPKEGKEDWEFDDECADAVQGFAFEEETGMVFIYEENIFGFQIASGSDEGLEESETSIEEFTDMFDTLKEIQKIFWISQSGPMETCGDMQKIKIFAGIQ